MFTTSCLPPPLPTSTAHAHMETTSVFYDESARGFIIISSLNFRKSLPLEYSSHSRWNTIIIFILGHQKRFGMEKTKLLFKTVLLLYKSASMKYILSITTGCIIKSYLKDKFPFNNGKWYLAFYNSFKYTSHIYQHTACHMADNQMNEVKRWFK